MRHLSTLLLILVVRSIAAQDIAGRWITIDDNTGEKRSVVDITISNGKAHGTIVDIHDKTKLERLCVKCEDDRKDKRILGMQIIRNMVRDGDEWEDGTILDPETGKVYDCKLWLEDGKLRVRGYVAFFFRTQTWIKEGQ